jgi:hypothetical protein
MLQALAQHHPGASVTGAAWLMIRPRMLIVTRSVVDEHAMHVYHACLS